MKKMLLVMIMGCALLAGCGGQAEDAGQDAAAADKKVVQPLPDTTMDNLDDAIFAVSLEEGGAYVDDTGKMQMDVKIYTYDKYDMVDIANLQVGDAIVMQTGEVEITSMDRLESGLIFVNGGLEEGGFDLYTDESGVFFETFMDDAKNWYEIGEATIPVSVDFEYHDHSDFEQGEVVYYPGSFLIGEVTDYNFTPYNTTIRVEAGEIVEMNRIFTP